MTQKKNLPTDKTVEKQQSTSIQHIQHSEVFSGPLPPPEFLFGYKNVQGDFPERVIRYAERDQEHRFDMEKRKIGMAEKELTYSFILRILVNILIVVMYLAMIASAGYFLANGSTLLASAAMSVPIATLAWVMVKSLPKKATEKSTEKP